MGNYRFKLSDMIPNAWFYKLKYVNRSSNTNTTLPVSSTSTKKHHHHHHVPSQPSNYHSPSTSLPRKSYYFTRRRSSNLTRPNRPSSVDSTTTTTKTDHSSDSSILLFESSPELRLDRVLTPETSTSLCDDIVIHVDENSYTDNLEDMFHELEIELPRIVTKPVKSNDYDVVKRAASRKLMSSKVPDRRHNKNRSSSSRKFSVHSPGKKIKIRSPKIHQARRLMSGSSRTATAVQSKRPPALSESFAIIKSSFDPQRDFRESMLEMIVEHNIKASKDLEDLLACYLSLNSDEYHHLIIKVFKQIWFDLTDIN